MLNKLHSVRQGDDFGINVSERMLKRKKRIDDKALSDAVKKARKSRNKMFLKFKEGIK